MLIPYNLLIQANLLDNYNIIQKEKYLFHGGRYLEGSDKEWAGTYNKLVNGDNFLFDCISMKDMYRYIYKN